MSATIQRWLDILAYVVCGLLFGLPLAPLYAAAWEKLLKYWPYQSLAGWVMIGPSLLLIVLVIASAKVRLRHFQHFWRYPPSVTAALIGVTFLVIVLVQFPAIAPELSGAVRRETMIALIITWFCVAAVLPATYRAVSRAKRARSRSNILPNPDLRKLPLSELLNWIHEERPVDLPFRDFFGAAQRARRIMASLQRRPTEPERRNLMQTVVLQGAFGSGKTSVIKHVAHLIRSEHPSDYVFVEVSAWGFSSAAGLYHILERAIEALNNEVDCLGLREVPQAYAEAVSEGGRWLTAILNRWLTDVSPLVRLKRLTPILQAIRSHLVIAIEDSDRVGADFNHDHLLAMLDDFRAIGRLSFILTTGDKRQFDFPKLAERIETIPGLANITVAELADQIRNHCLTKWPVIDCVTDDENRPPSLVQIVEATRDVKWRTWGMRTWPTNVAELLNTPRTLKAVLRSVVDSWEQLHGEVDFDELLIVTTLRYSAGPVFSFLVRRFADLQVFSAVGADAQQKEEWKEKLDELRDDWKDAIKECDGDPSAIERLVQDTFPAGGPLTAGKRFYQHSNRVQSLRSQRGNTYLDRIIAGEMFEGAVSDQDVLTALIEVGDGRNADAFADRFASSRDFAEVAIFFDATPQLSQSKRLAVSSLLIQGIISRSNGDRFEESPVHDLFSKWQSRGENDTPEYREWAANEILKRIPSDLLHATELYFDLIRDAHVAFEAQCTIRRLVVEKVISELSVLPPEEVALCFPSAFPYTLAHLIRLDGKEYPPEFMTRPADWTAIYDAVIAAANTNPSRIVPQLIAAFGKYAPPYQVYTTFEFVEDAVEEFCGEDVKQFFSVFRREFAIDPKLSPNFARLIPLARAEASSRLQNTGQ
jgi:hypothetical protein